MTKPNTYLDTELRRGRACLAVLATVALSACSADVMAPHSISPTTGMVLNIPIAKSSLVMLPTGSYGCGRAMAVNSTGVEGGNVFDCATPGIAHAALWVNGTLVVLPALASNGTSNVTALADDSTAVGFTVDALGVSHAASWKNGALTLLAGGMNGTAVGIGSDGVIVGSILLGGVRIPALWVNGSLLTDAQPQGYVGARFNSRAVGVVAGTALNPVNGVVRGTRAFRWWGPGNYQLLDLPAAASSVALGEVNDLGTVAGVAFGASGVMSVYWPGGSTTPVTVPVPSGYASSDMRAINNAGIIAGSLTGIGVGAATDPVTYDTQKGKWFKLASSGSFGAVYGSNDLAMFAGSVGTTSPQPVLWR
ncbi:MAG: hypothetical protein ACR2OG_14055 [Gemmatimonadaceae bacterium]